MYVHKNGIAYRKVGTQDLHVLFNMKAESWWGTHRTFISNIEDQRAWYDSLDHSSLVIVGTGQKEIMGVGIYSDIDWYSRCLSASFSVKKEHRDRTKDLISGGLDFIFEVLNMHRVSAEVVDSNIVAQKLEIDFLGFVVEGRKRQAVYKSGRYYDSIQIGMLREEWEQSSRVQELRKDTGSCNSKFDHVKIEHIMAKILSSESKRLS